MVLSLNPRQLAGLLRTEGQNVIFDLQVQGGETTPARIVESQLEPVRGTILHMDLHRVAMDRKLRVSVPVTLTGEPAGVKQQGGMLEAVLREVEVECFPADIPARVTVAVDSLMVGQSVRVSDLQSLLGEKVRLLQDANSVVCHVVSPKAVEEEKPAEVVAETPAEPEVIKKGKAVTEEEEAAEGTEKREKKEKGKE